MNARKLVISETREVKVKMHCKNCAQSTLLNVRYNRKKDRDGGLKLIPIFYTIGQLKILTKQSKKTFVIKFSQFGRKNNDRQLHTIR